MPALQTAHAIYKDEKLIFADKDNIPENGAEVIITFINKSKPAPVLATDPIRDLRGRGKGEKFAICIDNKGYEASLEIGKLYQVIPDKEADKHGYIRLIDESEEDYAFNVSRFHVLSLPPPVEKVLLSALRVEKTEILEV